jgi:PAS domain S-box-containing protein
MNNTFQYYSGILKYTLTGILLGLMLVVNAILLNVQNGFNEPWFHIFDYSPDFIIIAFSPLLLGLLFCFIGVKRAQLVAFIRQIKDNLTREQMISSVADQQVKLLAKVVSQIKEAVIISDKQGMIQWVNEGFTTITGYKMEEVTGKKTGYLLHGPLTDVEVAKRINEKLEKGESLVEEVINYKKDGTAYWVRISAKPIHNDAGEITNYISVETDITSKKEKEIAIERLYKEVADYKFALDESAIVIIFNNKGKIVHVNKKFCEINQLSENDFVGKDYRSISVSMRDKNTLKQIWDNLEIGKIWKGELINRNRFGKTYWADTTIVPLLNENGAPQQFLAIQNDITERKSLEIELLTSKNKLEQAMQIARFGTWEADIAAEEIYLSKELRQVCGIEGEGSLPLKDLFSNVHEEDVANLRECMYMEGGAITKTEVEYRFMMNGQLRYMISHIAPRLNENGEVTGSFGTMKDITQRKLTDLALKKSEEEKAVVLNNTQTIMCLHDLNGAIIEVNPAAERLTGFVKREIIGLNLKYLISPEHKEKFNDYIREIGAHKTASGSIQIINKEGKRRAWLYQSTLYEDNVNKPYVIASAVDVTESVKAQNEIERQQHLIRQIIDNNPNMVFVMNEHQQVVLANRTFSRFYPSYKETETPFACALSKGADDIFLGDADEIMDLQEGESMRMDGSMENPSDNNVVTWFSVVKRCFAEKNGKKYILGFGTDISGRYQIESDLIAANEMVERSLRVKDQFISNMSHEIRTPLNAVIGFTDLLSATQLSSEQTEYVGIVKTASQNLLALINNILDLAKIESGNLSLEQVPINIKQIVCDAIKILEQKAIRKKIDIRANFENEIPSVVLGDQLRLSQILFNLLGNAIKFTDEGYVEISCKTVEGSDDTKNYIAFKVSDTGIGVAPEKQHEIFERFTQANADTQRLYGGTGLGLNIAKSIVDMHGGTLKMQSQQGEGTSFHFILTYDKYEESTDLVEVRTETGATILSVNSNKPISILLAEDNMINAMLAIQVLQNGGFEVDHVVNGAMAVDAVKEKKYDVVLMDIQMPIMNGIAATEAIRGLEGEVSKIPIVAMTAHSLYGEMQNCYKSGMTGYVSKPFKTENLYKAIVDSMRTENEKRVFTNEAADSIGNI